MDDTTVMQHTHSNTQTAKTMTKPYGVVKYYNARYERYNPQIVAECDNLEDAETLLSAFAERGGCATYAVVHMTGRGLCMYNDGTPIASMPTYI